MTRCGWLTGRVFVFRFMRWAGNVRTFQYGTLLTAVGYFLWGQCYRFKGKSIWAAAIPCESNAFLRLDFVAVSVDAFRCRFLSSLTSEKRRSLPCGRPQMRLFRSSP